MSDLLRLLLALAVGLLLGLFYFGGLWWTVRRLPTARRPALLTLVSLTGRLAITLAGFYLVAGGRWERFAVSVLGFVAARMIVTRRLSPQDGRLPSREG